MRSPISLTLFFVCLVFLLLVPNQAAAQFYEAIEWEIFESVNEERSKQGLPALQMDQKLRDMARDHSKDMGDNNFYDHTSPTTGSALDRFNNNNVSFFRIAENINKFPWGSADTAMYGGSKTVDDVYITAGGWMDSAGHRANILLNDIDYIGIGVYRSSDGEYSYTQKFLGYHTNPSVILDPPTSSAPQLPAPPTPVSPSNGSSVAGDVTFQWEPSPGATYYKLNVNHPDIFAQILFVKVEDGTSYTWTEAPANGTTYNWSVAAGNDEGLSAFADGGSFTSVPGSNGSDSPPSAPTLTSPAHEAYVAGTSINFSWNAAANANDYQLRIIRLSDNAVFFNQTTGNTTSYTFHHFADDGERYRWEVRAGNNAGWSDFSTSRVFTNSEDLGQGSFHDVPPTHTFFQDIEAVAAAGITVGDGKGNYGPNDYVTRGQMAAFLVRAIDELNEISPFSPTFNDVSTGSTFYGHIEAVAAAGITLGDGKGNYGPNDYVTRGQMAAFLVRAIDELNETSPFFPTFNDVSSGSTFYGHVEAVAAAGITLGDGKGNYLPNDNVTRGQMAAFLSRALNL